MEFDMNIKAIRRKYRKKGREPYGYVINHDFRCEECAAGYDDEDRDDPVYRKPPLGLRCNGCGQLYLGDHEWGTRAELKERHKE